MHQTTELAHRSTLTALVGTYNKAVAQISEAYAMLDDAKNTLRAGFSNDYFEVVKSNHYGNMMDKLDSTLDGIKQQAWRTIVDRLELRRVLSMQRREELERQLRQETKRYGEKLPPLPDITEENILAMLQDGMAKAPEYAREAVYEVFDWLRPDRGRLSELKTNEKWKLGKKVIFYGCAPGYSKGKYRVAYHYSKNITAIDNVFHMLDGRGTLKTHNGPLHDAIEQSADGTGETDFFRFKCCKNGNIHLDFKRIDLVNKINSMAGGNRLKGGTQ